MYRLNKDFHVGDIVNLIVKDGYFTENAEGNVIDIVQRFDKPEYVVDVDGKMYQVPHYYLSYCNSEDIPEILGYKKVTEYLPKLNQKVILYCGDYNIKSLNVVEGTLVGNGFKHLGLNWYPGGTPLCNSISWCEIPKAE
jgi:hypothetical protein